MRHVTLILSNKDHAALKRLKSRDDTWTQFFMKIVKGGRDGKNRNKT